MKQKIKLILIVVLLIVLLIMVKGIVNKESNKIVNIEIPVKEMSEEEKEKYDVLKVILRMKY